MRAAMTVSRQWQTASWVDLGWLMAATAAFVAGKALAKLTPGIPGHAGMYWLPALFLARAGISRPGAASMTAMLGGAIWCLPRGDGGIDLASYVIAGIVLDLLDGEAMRLRKAGWSILAGALGMMGKYAFHLVPTLALALPAKFLQFGIGGAAASHVVFGAIGGGIGWFVHRAATRRMRRD